MKRTTGGLAAATLAVPLMLGLVACGGDSPMARWRGADRPAPVPDKPMIPLSMAVSPAANAQNQPISTEIGVQVSGGTIAAVALTEAGAPAAIAGRLREDGTAWVPDQPLRYKKSYTATVAASGADGTSHIRTTTFTTMAEPRGERVGTGLYLFDGQVYGQAMPLVIEFDTVIPEAARAGVERRLFVTTSPPQPGAWAWFEGRQALYRAKEFWRPGTRITVRSALDGHPMGGGRFGDTDRRAASAISPTRTVVSIDNATKQLTVLRDDLPIKSFPISLGKPSTPSSSGTMVIMEKRTQMTFDTRRDPNPSNRYVVDVQYAQRLTWGGEFIHAAPWSVGDQGVRNVSHGCINMSTGNAHWLFSITKIGDPVVVKGTEVKLYPGNGWTAWDLTWPDHVSRSALPHPELAESLASDLERGPNGAAPSGAASTATPGR